MHHADREHENTKGDQMLTDEMKQGIYRITEGSYDEDQAGADDLIRKALQARNAKTGEDYFVTELTRAFAKHTDRHAILQLYLSADARERVIIDDACIALTGAMVLPLAGVAYSRTYGCFYPADDE
jgi:hypothetical protein